MHPFLSAFYATLGVLAALSLAVWIIAVIAQLVNRHSAESRIELWKETESREAER